MRDPQVYVRPVVYRPIRIDVGGEVKRPGYYTLSGETNLNRLSESAESQQLPVVVQHVGSITRNAPPRMTGTLLKECGRSP